MLVIAMLLDSKKKYHIRVKKVMKMVMKNDTKNDEGVCNGTRVTEIINIDEMRNLLYNKTYNKLYIGGATMKNNLFGEKVSYENFAPPFVLIALMSRFVNRYQSAANAFLRN